MKNGCSYFLLGDVVSYANEIKTLNLKSFILNSLARIRRVMPKDMKLIKDMITDPPLFEYTTPEGLIYAID